MYTRHPAGGDSRPRTARSAPLHQASTYVSLEGGSRLLAQEDLDEAWESVRAELRREVSEFTFRAWLDDLTAASYDDGRLRINAPDHARDWVARRYGSCLRVAAQRALGASLEIELIGDQASARGSIEDRCRAREADGTLNPKYTFGRFVIGDGNRLAHAAALAIAEQPAQVYNPLFIYGHPGFGKTHLLQAIGSYVGAHGLGLTVRYAPVETFVSGFIQAVRQSRGAAFKSAFRDTDVLLIDDVQFLAGKEKTREEFFHTFNALYENGRQLVIASDRPPHELGELEPRLIERFGCGLVAALDPPNMAARMTILRKRARDGRCDEICDSALQEIAHRVTTNVRALEGALTRVLAYASLHDRAPTPELASELLLTLYPERATAPPTVAEIQAETARAFGVDRTSLLSHSRSALPSRARHVAIYLSRELTKESLPSIGKLFGGRNHSTIIHAHRRVRTGLEQGGPDANTVESLRRSLSSNAR